MDDLTPTTAAVRCIHCGKEGTHRVCDEWFKATDTAATVRVCCVCLFRRGTRPLIVTGPWICPSCDRMREQGR